MLLLAVLVFMQCKDDKMLRNAGESELYLNSEKILTRANTNVERGNAD